MSLFSSTDTVKSLLINYIIGFVGFIGLLFGVSMIFHDPDSKGVKADGSIDLGLPQTYFEAMFTIGPGTMFIAMILSSILVYAMTNLRKGIEALLIGILCSVLLGGFVTMNIEQALDSNLHESGASNIILDVKDRAIYTSYLLVGNLFLWANFFLEVIRFKGTDSLSE
jgi:hypothetical protein